MITEPKKAQDGSADASDTLLLFHEMLEKMGEVISAMKDTREVKVNMPDVKVSVPDRPRAARTWSVEFTTRDAEGKVVCVTTAVLKPKEEEK